MWRLRAYEDLVFFLCLPRSTVPCIKRALLKTSSYVMVKEMLKLNFERYLQGITGSNKKQGYKNNLD